MARFVISTCGVAAEVVAVDLSVPSSFILLGLGGAFAFWAADARRLIDHLVGLDRPACQRAGIAEVTGGLTSDLAPHEDRRAENA